MNEEDDTLDDCATRLERLVEVVLTDVAADCDDCTVVSACPVETVGTGVAGCGPIREIPDVPTDPIWLMVQLLRLGDTELRPVGRDLATRRPSVVRGRDGLYPPIRSRRREPPQPLAKGYGS